MIKEINLMAIIIRVKINFERKRPCNLLAIEFENGIVPRMHFSDIVSALSL